MILGNETQLVNPRRKPTKKTTRTKKNTPTMKSRPKVVAKKKKRPTKTKRPTEKNGEKRNKKVTFKDGYENETAA